MDTAVHLVDVGVWMPERWMTAEEIGSAAGIPPEVIVDRFGLDGKYIAGPDDHVSSMGAAAARRAMERAGFSAADLDLVVYFGSMWKDYMVWSAAPKIQDLIGATAAWSLELSYVSCGTPVALKVVADMMRSDPALEQVLVVGGSRESHLLDYTNPRSRFMFNFGDGAAAAVLGRAGGHEIVSSAIHTDGRFADDVAVYGGGSIHPTSERTLAAGMHHLDVGDQESMKERLDSISGPNFVAIAREACTRAGIRPSDVALLAPIHFKRSFFEWVVAELGIPPERTVYLRHHGHMSGIDPLVGIDARRDQLRPGDWVLLLAAGTGYTWAATVLRW
jgi:3-oxoacyl-[acyl-carrier-protein] synthase-3